MGIVLNVLIFALTKISKVNVNFMKGKKVQVMADKDISYAIKESLCDCAERIMLCDSPQNRLFLAQSVETLSRSLEILNHIKEGAKLDGGKAE